MAKLRGQIKGIRRGQRVEAGCGVTGMQGLLDFSEALRRQTAGENVHHLVAQFLIRRCCGDKIFSGALIERRGVEFVSGHVPPAGQGGADQKISRDFLPDQGLYIFRSNEVFFRGRQHVGQLGQRTNQIGATACRGSLVEQFRSLPELGHPHDGFSGKVVGADKERVVVQELGTRRLVVGVIEANHRVAEKRRELPLGLFPIEPSSRVS